MNRKLRQAVSLLMSTTIVVIPPNVSTYAVEKESNLCEHHIEHTEECKYTEVLGEDSCEYECAPCSIIPDKDAMLDSPMMEDKNNSVVEDEAEKNDAAVEDEEKKMMQL